MKCGNCCKQQFPKHGQNSLAWANTYYQQVLADASNYLFVIDLKAKIIETGVSVWIKVLKYCVYSIGLWVIQYIVWYHNTPSVTDFDTIKPVPIV